MKKRKIKGRDACCGLINFLAVNKCCITQQTNVPSW